jgi:DNA-binding transcriptional regulator LsrR (DeoR family)
MATDHKSELVDFLVRKAFDPVLKAKPDGRSDADKKVLEHVQEATRSEIARYRGYGSAQEVVTNFKRDLTSSAAKKVHGELERLKLPTLHDVREEFKEQAQSLGVNASS